MVTGAANPVGELVDPSAAQLPAPVTLAGRFVTLVPLDPKAHAQALYEGACGEGREDLWTYLFDGPFPDRAVFEAAMERKANSTEAVFLAILDNASGRAAGYASYMRITPAHRCMEVGSVLLIPALQRTSGATEAMYLMARHAFEDLRYRRYEWKCNALHQRSRRAALRLGFTFEGIFREHMIVKGRSRDTAWFSMIDREWPARKAALEGWLAPSNFDGEGRQRKPLAAFATSSPE